MARSRLGGIFYKWRTRTRRTWYSTNLGVGAIGARCSRSRDDPGVCLSVAIQADSDFSLPASTVMIICWSTSGRDDRSSRGQGIAILGRR